MSKRGSASARTPVWAKTQTKIRTLVRTQHGVNLPARFARTGELYAERDRSAYLFALGVMTRNNRPIPLLLLLSCMAGCAEDESDPEQTLFDAAITTPIDASPATDAGGTAPGSDSSTPKPNTDAGAGGSVADAAASTSDAGTGPARDAATSDAKAEAGSDEKDAASSTGHAGNSASDAGSSASDGGNASDAGVGPKDAGTPTIGNGGTVDETIVVKKGETFDGMNKRYKAGSGLGDGSQSEGQKPVFKLEDGAKIRNVVLGAPAADGIHTYGNVTLENIVWEDIGEDALTIKESGTVVLNGGSAKNGDDKVFQVNAASTFRISNFTASNAGKFIRQNGGTTFKVAVFIDRCDISNMKESIFRTDSSSSTVSMTNSRYSKIGDKLWYGVNTSNITVSNNTEY
jgi:hypothetical protein